MIFHFFIKVFHNIMKCYENSLMYLCINRISYFMKQILEKSDLVKLVTRQNYKDEALESSLFYRIAYWPYRILKKASYRYANVLEDVVNNSFIASSTQYLFERLLLVSTRFYGLFVIVFVITEAVLTIAFNGFWFMPVLLKFIVALAGVFFVLLNKPLKDLYIGSCIATFVGDFFAINDKLITLPEKRCNKRFVNTLAIVVGFVLGVCAFFLTFKWFVFSVGGIIGLALVLWKVEIGVLAIILLVHFIPTMMIAGLTVVTFISFVLRAVFDKKFTVITTHMCLWIIIFAGILLYGGITSFTFASSMKISMIYIVFILFYFIFVSTVKTKGHIYSLMTIFMVCGFFVSLYGIYQYLTGAIGAQAWVDADMFADIKVRVYSTFENPNVLGEYLILLIPVCLGLMWAAKKWHQKVVFTGITVTMCICLVLTYSRGSWVGLLLAIGIFALFVDRRLILLGIPVLMVLPLMMPESIINRFMSIGNLTDSSSSYRVYIWLGTLNMLKDYWLSGIGLGTEAFNQVYPLYNYAGIVAPHAHNVYLHILSEMGIMGLVAMLVILYIFLKMILITYLNTKDRFIKIFVVSVGAGMAGYLLQGMFDNVWYNFRVFLIFWMYMAFVVAARNIQKRSEKSD